MHSYSKRLMPSETALSISSWVLIEKNKISVISETVLLHGPTVIQSIGWFGVAHMNWLPKEYRKISDD